MNAHGQHVPFHVNAITETHAEADVFAQAARAGVFDRTGRLFVDRVFCPACGLNGGVRTMARQLGLQSLQIDTPTSSYTMTIDPLP